MDRIDELLARDHLTDDEMAELEAHLVATTRELHRALANLADDIADSNPFLARRLSRSNDSMLRNVEKAASLPWPDGSPGALSD